MITLGIDTSLSNVSFAVVKDSQVLAEFNGDIGRNLADRIGEIITNLLKKAEVSVREIDRCGIVVGPGSFTGLRIGIAFAKGLFADSNAKIIAVSSLECALKSSDSSAVFFDARQDEVFFKKNKNEERILFENAVKQIDKSNKIVYSFSGNSSSPIKKLLQNFECVEAETLKNRGAVAAKIAEKSEHLQTIDEIFPNYMQISYAERMRSEECEVIRKILIILFVVVLFCFAQEEIAAEIDSVETQRDVSVDTTEILDTIFENLEIPEEKSKKVSWYFSLSPRVGVDRIQKDYAKFLKERSDSIFRNEFGSGFRQTWFQPASASGISFYLGTGVSAKINANSSVDAGVGYSFNQSRAVYNVENSLDSTEILRMRALLVNNSLWLSTNYKVGFDSSYFHIKGIDIAGFYAGGAFVLSRYFERDTIKVHFEEYQELAENRRRNYDGFGGAGRAGLFAQQKIGRHSLFEYSIGYLFSATTGYEGFWDRKFYWESNKNKHKILSISNSFELSFSLIF